MQLLSVNADAKTVKGTKKGFLTGIVYLAPANESGVMNVCTSASDACTKSCLYNSGRAQIFPAIKEARIRKTLWLHNDRSGFLNALRSDIRLLVKQANRMKLTPCVRNNGTSDLPWLSMQLASEFPQVQFYDYTKHPRPWERIRSNYHLTFSHSEVNLSHCLDALSHGVNVAVVFDTRKGQELPKTWHGYRVIDGDISDLRFLDSPVVNLTRTMAQPVIVGLRAKGQVCKSDLTSGFVQIASRIL